VIDFGPAAFLAAFGAGFVSFASPCVLPLLPGYLSYVSGVSVDELGANRRRVTVTTGWFVAGFGAMFVAFGAGAAWLGDVLLTNRRSLEIVAGSFIVLAGLVHARVPLPLLVLREKRARRRRAGALTPALTGVAFAIGWTPCVGPTLAAILALSAGSGTAGQGALLLGVYALGLGMPFLVAGLAFTGSLTVIEAVRSHWRLVGFASGAVLVAFGVLLITGRLFELTSWLARFTGVAV
jgi:cytochrome c-type biogenesis protein